MKQKLLNYWKTWLGPSSATGAIKIASMAATFLIMLLLARRGGSETLGLFSLGLTTIQLVALVVGFGLPNYLMQQVAWSRSQKNSTNNIGAEYSTSLWLVALWGAIVSGFLFFGSVYLSEKLFENMLFAEVLRWAAVAVIPYTLLVLHSEALRGLGFPVLSQILHAPIIALLTLAWILAGPHVGFHASASVTMAGYACSSWMVALLGIYFWKMKSGEMPTCLPCHKEASLPFGERIWQHIKRARGLLQKGSVFLIAAVALTILTMTDTLMLGILSTIDNVGGYSAASRLAGSLAIILFGVNNILAPRLGHSYANGDMSAFSKQLHAGITLSFWPTLLIGGILLQFSAEFLSLFGSEFGKNTLVMQILVIGVLVNALCGPVGWVLCMTGRESIFQRILLVIAVLNIFFNTILIPLYGAIGAAIATAVCTVLLNIIAAIIVSRSLGVCTVYGFDRFLKRGIDG